MGISAEEKSTAGFASAPAGDRKSVVLLGATGSIGQSTLSVLDDNADRYDLYAVSAHRNIAQMLEIILRYEPVYAVVSCADCEKAAAELSKTIAQKNISTQILVGAEHLDFIASSDESDIVVAAIVGAAGLSSTIAAAESGKQLLLANKEAIVMGGRVFMQAVQKGGATLLPIDSEHNAIFQCLPPALTDRSCLGTVEESYLKSSSLEDAGISKILLTGSGGPFRAYPISELKHVTPEQACAHPNWDMGKKISVDSATMMNKGLELIEACWLFDCEHKDIDIVIHPQSIVHSMVQYKDGSVLAQMGQPDMRTPIAHALAWPKRIANKVEPLNWREMADLTFEDPDVQRFPALTIAREVAAARDSAAIVMNAANEMLVDAFLDRRIRFDQISDGVAAVLDDMSSRETPSSVDEIVAIDHETRAKAAGLIANDLG